MALEAFFVFCFGLIFGSFFNVCIYRMPEDKSLGGRSKCRSCRKKIPAKYNIPVVSYIWLRGRTACCNKRISIQYPLVELASGMMFAGLFLYYGMGWHFICYTVLLSELFVLSVIDFHHQIIPDEISLSGIVLGFIASFLTKDITWTSSLIGIFVGGGIFFSIAYLYEKISGREGLGGGDVKLLAMLGAWFGLESILVIVVLSTTMGALVGLSMIAAGKANSKAAIPFGPFMAFAAVIYLFYAQDLIPFFYPTMIP